MISSSRIVMATAFAALIAAGAAYAQDPRPRGRGPEMGGQSGLMLRDLDLTDAQREQVKQLTQQHREQTRTLFERARAAREAERRAAEAMPFSEQELRSAMQALGEVQTELAIQQARLRSDIHALLTPDQHAKLRELRADRDARVKKRQERFEQRRQQRQTRPQA